MDTVVSRAGTSPAGTAEPDPRRWRALAVLVLVQFMLVLDVTVVNVALPRIQHDLKFSPAGLAWVVDGYIVMAGGLLLLGGRLADVFGRRRLFLLGVAVFAVASVLCGAAVSSTMLIPGRFLQGAGEAMASPASLGLIALLFPDVRERMKAIGMWGAVSGLAGVCGTILSGVLTGMVSWRWIFFINLPVAIFALVVVPRLVAESRMARGHRRLGFTGAVTGTAGLVAVVYGLLQAASYSWGSARVLVPLLGGAALVLAMVLIEARSAAPLIPLRFFTNRTRVVANVVTLFGTAAFFTYVFLLTLFIQEILGYSPLRGGLSFLPLGIGMVIGVGLGTGLMPKIGVKALAFVGFLGAAVGMVLTSFIHVGAGYVGSVLPGMFVVGVFFGSTIPATVNSALHGTTGDDSSLASGVQNAMLQIGGALGLATLVPLALRHANADMHLGVSAPVAIEHGYALAFRVAAALLLVGGVLALVFLEHVIAQPRTPGAEPVPAPANA
jgi:EmrB/QacA subfamily drug resistance transporter